MEALADYGPVLALIVGILGMTLHLSGKIDKRVDSLSTKIEALDAGSRGRDERLLEKIEAVDAGSRGRDERLLERIDKHAEASAARDRDLARRIDVTNGRIDALMGQLQAHIDRHTG